VGIITGFYLCRVLNGVWNVFEVREMLGAVLCVLWFFDHGC
jgi:hypothetical protein